MKKILSYLFLSLFVLTISCSDSDEEQHNFDSTIGMVLYEPTNEFRTLVIDYAVKKATQLGNPYDLKLPANAEEQKKELTKMANNGIKTIILGDLGVEASFLNDLIAKGVNLVLYDGEVNCNYVAFISGDNIGLGERAGEFFREKTEVSKIVVLTVPSSSTISNIRINAFKSTLGEGKTLVEIPISTHSEGALLEVLDDILAENPDGVYTQDDVVAYALATSIGDKPHPIKAIFGAAGYQPYLRLMKSSAIDLGSATYSPIYVEQCVEIASNLMKGIKPEKKRVVVASELITKENVDSYLKENGNF